MPKTQTPRPPLQDLSSRTNQDRPSIDLYKARDGCPTANADASVTLNGRVMSVDEAVAEVKKSLGLPADMTSFRLKYDMPDPVVGKAPPVPPAPDRIGRTSAGSAPKTGTKRKSTSSTSKAGPDEPAASKKRKAEDILAEDIKNFTQTLPGEEDIEDSSYPGDGWGPVDQTCGVVRGKLNRLFDNGVMTKKAFCDAVNAPNNTLNRFLATRGTYGGEGSSIYIKAWKWFKLREDRGIKMPDVKKRKQTIASNAAKATATSNSDASNKSGAAKASTAKSSSADKTPDLSSIELDGEEDDDVPIYDSCDEIRKKISAYLKNSCVTQAQFCRDLFDQYQQPPCKSIQSTVLNRFRGGKGPITGTKSTVYYAAYVFFEKLRIAQGKPKSKHREGMEEAWWPHGVDRTVDSNTSYLGFADEVATMDEFGRMTIRRNGRVSWQG